MMLAEIIVWHINKDPMNNHAPAPLFSPHPSYCQRLITLLDNGDRVHLENLSIHALRALRWSTLGKSENMKSFLVLSVFF